MSNSFDSFGPLMISQLREQVQTLLASAELLTPMTEQEGNQRYRTYLAIMNKNLYQMQRLTDNVELTTLPEEHTPRLQGVDLADLCSTLCREIASLSPHLEVSFDYQGDKPSLLTTADPNLLTRMILNIASNAIKGAGKGGQAGLRLSSTKERVILTFWDNGQGLPFPEDGIPQLDHAAGLGLGLEVARQVIIHHKGTLLFDQKDGQGGRAIVSLPIIKPNPGTSLYTPYQDSGKASRVMVELSTILSAKAFLPQHLD